MKHLPVHNKQYRALIREFSLYLERLGYNSNICSALPSCLQEFFYWLEKMRVTQVTQITPQLIRSHYDYLSQRPNQNRSGGLSSSHITHHLYALKTFFNYQQETGRIEINPFSVLYFPRMEYPPRRVLSVDEITALYKACENMRDQVILGLFYGCGLRRSEAIRLNIMDINFKGQLLYVRCGKGKRRRVIPMTDKVTAYLRHYYLYERNLNIRRITGDNHQAFVLNNHGGRMLGCGYWKRFRYLTGQAGLSGRVSLHNLRHSIATHLLENGLSIEQVRDFLGHRHLESTQIYTRVSSLALSRIHESKASLPVT